MSRKALTMLVLITVIVGLVAIPSLAQATQAQCGSVECASSATIRFQSTNLKIKTQAPEGELVCASTTFEGPLNNQGSTMPGFIFVGSQAGCTANGVSADVKSNLSAEPLGWRWSVQQPEATGQVTAHVVPDAAGTIRFTTQVQVFGFSVATCTFEAKEIKLMGTEQSDTMSVEGSNQFTLVASNSSECGTVNTTKGDLTGSFQLETTSGEAVVVHMS